MYVWGKSCAHADHGNVCMYICMSIYMYVCMQVRVAYVCWSPQSVILCGYVCMVLGCKDMHACIHMNSFPYMCIYIYIYIYIYIHV
jgi:hypothetical protein